MASSIAAQLKAIKSQLGGAPEPLRRRPFTRPSILFGPKEAADIDLRTILPISLSGLEVLIGLDSKFERYRSTLFSQASLDVDREKLAPNEEERVSKSISSYLRLLAGHLQLPAAVKTLEYLIRRYKVHMYNVDDLISCVLPYHDTQVFVRIVQLMDLGNNKLWCFLEGVKLSGAPPPRTVIVQQCIRDKGVLEAICNYASPTRDFRHGRNVICFCTSVIVEALGSISKLDEATLKRVLPFVFNGLNPAMKGGLDEQAGALMVVGLLTTRVTLAPKLVNNFLFCISRLVHEDNNAQEDLLWLRVILMAIVSLVQSQTIHMLPEKCLKLLVQIKDLPGVLLDISANFNITKFLSILLDTLACYGSSDERCCSMLAALLDIISVEDTVCNVIVKMLGSSVKFLQNHEDSSTEVMVKPVLSVISKKYKNELSSAIHQLLKNSKRYCMEEETMRKNLWLMFGGSLGQSLEISHPTILHSHKHPDDAAQQALLMQLSSSSRLKEKLYDPSMLVNAQEAILLRLKDDDLTVVHNTLSINELSSMVDTFALIEALKAVLIRCLNISKKGPSGLASQACNIAVLCLNISSTISPHNKLIHVKEVSKMLFPLLLILPKTYSINLRALELAREMQWPFFLNAFGSHDISMIPSTDSMKTLDAGKISSLNTKMANALANTFWNDPGEYLDWLIECSKGFEPSRSFVLYILLQLVLNYQGDIHGLLRLYDICFPIVKTYWSSAELKGSKFLPHELNAEKLDAASSICMNELLGCKFDSGNALILNYIIWAFLSAFSSMLQNSFDNPRQLLIKKVEDLFLFLAPSSQKLELKELLFFLVTKCTISPVQFLSSFYTELFPTVIQEESLCCFSKICSGLATMSVTNTNALMELLANFPALLVPLSCETKMIRMAAISCIDELFKLWHQLDISRTKNGNNSPLVDCISSPIFGKLLGLIISQKKFILSDVNFLPSFMTSLLGTSSESFAGPSHCGEQFNAQEKDAMTVFILSSVVEMSSFAKVAVFSLLKGIGNISFKIDGVRLLFSDLVDRRNLELMGNSCPKLSATEVELLCTLLEASILVPNSDYVGDDLAINFLKCLKVGKSLLDEPVIIRPCITALQNTTFIFYSSLKDDVKKELFCFLVLHFHNENASIREAAKEALLRIKVSCSTIINLLGLIISKGNVAGMSKRIKRRNVSDGIFFPEEFFTSGISLSILKSILEILMLKKDIEDRHLFVEPLFNLLEVLYSVEWVQNISSVDDQSADSPAVASIVSDVIVSVQQSTLMILEDICSLSIANISAKMEMSRKFKIQLLIDCARSTENATTRNHIFLLLCSYAKVFSSSILEHMLDLFGLVGEVASRQYDNHSQQVLEALISTLVPCWLAKTDSTKALLEVFLEALPQIAEHRRLKLTLYVLRTLGEKNSLGNFLALMFRALAIRKIDSFDWDIGTNAASFSILKCKEWEYSFSEEICNQFSCITWLPSLVIFLEDCNDDVFNRGCFQWLLSLHFLLEKLQDTVLHFEVKSGKLVDHQCTLSQLMERVILHTQFVMLQDKQKAFHPCLRKLLKEVEQSVLRAIASIMVPSEFFKGVTKLLDHSSVNVKRKALQLLRDFLKNDKLVLQNHRSKRRSKKVVDHPLHYFIDDIAIDAFNKMCLKIINLTDSSHGTGKSSLRCTAISCVEVFTNVSLPGDWIFTESLAGIVKNITSDDLSICSASLKCTASLVSVLGPKALVELPNIMKHLMQISHDCVNMKSGNTERCASILGSNVSISHSILLTLESVVDHLGGFLNPHLEDIMKLLVTHREYISDSDVRINAKAIVIRKLVIEKIPVRLTLSPLLKVYPQAVKSGEVSLSLAFEMLAAAVNSMDRSLIGNYHGKIFDHCLLALDLRRLHPDTIKNINLAEENVILAIVALTMKLTESMFRPLFLRSIEWAESEVEDSGSVTPNIDRLISFYGLVNKLLEHQRSLFVPYFKYLLDGIKNYLTTGCCTTRKRKKSKVSESSITLNEKGKLEPKQWHLRALIISSLYKCFLYDSGNLKFLDPTNFQVLLNPIVTQLVMEPPQSNDHALDLPTTEEVNESLVYCLGQMAVTAASDDIWKHLNHEVLMQTRNEKVRPRILGLRVVKFLMEHLKEEYIVLLPETIPFLSELLEDVEHPVKLLAQEIFKELETLSGEDLKQYL